MMLHRNRCCTEIDAVVHVHEIMADHAHFFVESDPRWSGAEIVNRIKGASFRKLKNEFPQLKSRFRTQKIIKDGKNGKNCIECAQLMNSKYS